MACIICATVLLLILIPLLWRGCGIVLLHFKASTVLGLQAMSWQILTSRNAQLFLTAAVSGAAVAAAIIAVQSNTWTWQTEELKKSIVEDTTDEVSTGPCAPYRALKTFTYHSATVSTDVKTD